MNDGPFTICLSEDGTVIDDDEVLVEYKDKVMLLLKCSEVYCTESAITVEIPSVSEGQTAHSDNGESRGPVGHVPPVPLSPVASEHNERKF